MIETPASALIADSLAPLVSFFSIGTNDLTQYTMAADRLNEYVSDIYDPFNPAVIRLMKMAIESAKKYGIHIGICGELAGHSASTELLIGLGIQEISVSPPLLLELKKRILHINYREVSQLH
jgi:phosphotransferase system enzyme I (PtsI)